MLYDNKQENRNVWQWIEQATQEGKLDVITGYFTVGILALISKKLNDKITEFRFVAGDIVCPETEEDHPIDLLSETISIDAAVQLNKVAKEAVAFLRQEKVKIKTVEPNFCHAKAVLFRSKIIASSYFVTGSSNLTEAGLGLKPTSNVELNLVGQGTAADCDALFAWFDNLWSDKAAVLDKTVEGKKVPFKSYIIEQIEKIYLEYTPKQLYYKTLFELFSSELAALDKDKDTIRQIEHLKNTKIYKSLYDFQQKGVLSLIKKIKDYGGAILADAVGLGKTWSALAIVKYYQMKGYETILLCPKKLEQNWRKYLKRHKSRFEEDAFDYVIRFHSDLQDDRLESNHADGLSMESFFTNDKPKFIVVDESHNLRNNASLRYKTLVEKILQDNQEVKVLLLSATPINTGFKDIRNQFALLVKGQNTGFKDMAGMDIPNLASLFAVATRSYKEWAASNDRTLTALLKSLPEPLLNMMDKLVVARTRSQVKAFNCSLRFPTVNRPVNYAISQGVAGCLGSIAEIIAAMPETFAAYKPACYIKKQSGDALKDEQQRDESLVAMLKTLLLKRLESSWFAFYMTINKVLDVHKETQRKIAEYEERAQGRLTEEDVAKFNQQSLLFTDVFESDDDITFGKRKIKLVDVIKEGRLEAFKADLTADIMKLEMLSQNLGLLSTQIRYEVPAAESRDVKLARLIELIREKQGKAGSGGNRKVIIFSTFKDTVTYLYEELERRGFSNMAMVTGDFAKSTHGYEGQDFEPLLEQFAPYTKLYMEREWVDFDLESPRGQDSSMSTEWERFQQWRTWCQKGGTQQSRYVSKQLNQPIDILIATDCLSEGQNLQDADYLVNYDIHWNPVRIIQRMGRIDRLGSPNSRITGVNFWPCKELEQQIELQMRVENRCVAMATAGTEIGRTGESLEVRITDSDFEQQQTQKMLEQMKSSWEDIGESSGDLGFDSFSLELFRQDLIDELQNQKSLYSYIPSGVFTGFMCAGGGIKRGIIALLGYPSRKGGRSNTPYLRHDLVYLDMQGETINHKTQEVLDMLKKHQDYARFVPAAIDSGQEEAIKLLSEAVHKWLHNQVSDGGVAQNRLMSRIQAGNIPEEINESGCFEDTYDPVRCDLILWFIVSAEE